MKTKILKFLAILLMLTGSLACEKDSSPETILGVWGLVAYGYSEDRIVPIPAEYLDSVDLREFLPDGTIRYYSQKEKEYYTGLRKASYITYKIFLYVYYAYDELAYTQYKYQFINENQLKLTFVQDNVNKEDIMTPIIYIYQRKKITTP